MSKFSVLHECNGTADLYQCDRVTYHRANSAVPAMGALELRDHDEVFVAALWGGSAYVMNAAGKTVARYDLPDDPRSAGPMHHPV